MSKIILSELQQEIIDYKKPGPLIIRGIAGSGKTTVAVKRVSSLLEKDITKSETILLVTYQKTLRNYLDYIINKDKGNIDQYSMMFDKSNKVTIATIDQLIHKNYEDFKFDNQQYKKLPTIVKEFCFNILVIALDKLGYEDNVINYNNKYFLRDEINYINSNRIMTESQYQIFERKGRNKSKNNNHNLRKKSDVRKYLFKLRTLYIKSLLKENEMDFPVKRLLALTNIKKYIPKQYSHIIIDESQDLDRTRIDFLKFYLQDIKAASVTFLYDTTQSIYAESWLGNNHSFKSLGINITGGNKTFVLNKNFRTTYEIQDLAQSFIESKDNLKQSINPILTNKAGLKPNWINCENYENQIHVISNIIKTLKTHVNVEDIIIACRTKAELTSLKQALKNENLETSLKDDNSIDFYKKNIRLMTMHSTKGIECQAMFIINVNENAIPLSGTSDAEITEKKLFYVALTRASKYLYITSFGKPSIFISQDLEHSKLNKYESGNQFKFTPIKEHATEIDNFFSELEKVVTEFPTTIPKIITHTQFKNQIEKITLDRFKCDQLVEKMKKYQIPENSYLYILYHNYKKSATEHLIGYENIIKNLIPNNTEIDSNKDEFTIKYPNFKKTTITSISEVVFQYENGIFWEQENQKDWSGSMTLLSKVLEKEMKQILINDFEFDRYEINNFTLVDLIEKFKIDKVYNTVGEILENSMFRRERNKATHSTNVNFRTYQKYHDLFYKKNGLLNKLNELLD